MSHSPNNVLQLESLLKDERERGAILGEKLETAEVELTERLETIEALKTEMAKHKDVAEKSKGISSYSIFIFYFLFLLFTLL